MKNYVSKWILQRLTAIILIPLTFWFVYQCILLSSYSYDEIKAFFFSKLNSSLYLILVITMLYHAKIGCETIIEDYVNSPGIKKITNIFISTLVYILIILTTISIFFIVSL